MDFIPEYEYEVIREEFSHKLYKPIFNPSNKVWRDSTQTKTPTLPFHIGDSLRYTNEGHNYMVYLVGMNTNGHDSIKYIRGPARYVSLSIPHPNWVKHKFVSRLYQPIFPDFLYLNSVQYFSVVELCRETVFNFCFCGFRENWLTVFSVLIFFLFY